MPRLSFRGEIQKIHPLKKTRNSQVCKMDVLYPGFINEDGDRISQDQVFPVLFFNDRIKKTTNLKVGDTVNITAWLNSNKQAENSADDYQLHLSVKNIELVYD